MKDRENVRYFERASGVIVRVIDDVTLDYLTESCDWVPNQDWYVSMFIEGIDPYQEVGEDYVNKIIEDKLNATFDPVKQYKKNLC